MERSNRNYAFVVPFVDALAGLGLREACITPGSRNTPLSLAFAEHTAISDWSHHDERSSAFFALGLAKASRRPVAVVCTSGTAAAELLPAAVEARNGRVPLLLLTADRPPELRGVGAPQTIDQVKLYGDTVKWFHEVGAPEPTIEFIASAPSLALRAWAAAVEVPPGPVHLNFAFREPLVPTVVPGDVPDDLPERAALDFLPEHRIVDDDAIASIATMVSGKRTIVVCGPQEDPALAAATSELASAAGFPVLADPLSQVRCGTHDLSAVIAHGHALISAGFVDRNPADAVLRFGAPPTSKALSGWLADHPEVPQVVVDPGGWRDPYASATVMVRSDPVLAASALSKAITKRPPAAWQSVWQEANRVAGEALERSVAAAGFPTEPGVVESMGRALPPGSTLWAASSMPIRDVEAFLPAIPRPLRIMANRGANGIDGLLSSGLGSASVGSSPTYVLAGDLSALHDLTALVTASRYQIPATIVVVHNDGGGIFHFLPQTEYPEHFERHFATPHGLDFVAVAGVLGVPGSRVEDQAELEALVTRLPDGPFLVEVRTDRHANVAIHRDAQEAVKEALSKQR